MTFSWKELVCHGLLKELGDPSLTKDLLKVVMKKNRNHLEEEAREYHSDITKDNLLYILTMTIPSRDGKLRDRLLERYFAGELGSSIGIHRDVTDELLASWQERKPYRRRDAVWTAFCGGWKEQLADLNFIIDDPSTWLLRTATDEEENVAKCDWFQEIHEGRYYLFWHKDSFKEASHFTHWSVTASIDINVIEGRTEENPWGSQRYPDICWDPKYLRENSKERKHMDDMFRKG
jgi:nitroimidazol reductase NimA-like FMN-containing flavoprotein (pyridoxamine 5'-phosphate oxidase superfamily)